MRITSSLIITLQKILSNYLCVWRQTLNKWLFGTHWKSLESNYKFIVNNSSEPGTGQRQCTDISTYPFKPNANLTRQKLLVVLPWQPTVCSCSTTRCTLCECWRIFSTTQPLKRAPLATYRIQNNSIGFLFRSWNILCASKCFSSYSHIVIYVNTLFPTVTRYFLTQCC